MIRALEQVTVFLTLLRQLEFVMEHERRLLRSMRFDALDAVREEKGALLDAYRVELRRLRESPDVIGQLDPPMRSELVDALRTFQDALHRNRDMLMAARENVGAALWQIERSLRLVTQGRRSGGGGGGGAEVISLAEVIRH
ncbi:MAG: hypothetical protein ACFB3T_11605 [Geminicoccaceae bacterium]